LARWYYIASSRDNKQSGYIEANSLLLAKIKLKEQNIDFVKIKKVTWFFLLWDFCKRLYFSSLLKQQNRLEFVRSLSVLLRSGISILQALTILSEENAKKSSVHSKEFVIGKLIYSNLQAGDSIANAFSKSGAFDSLLVNLLEIGENTGKLYEILDYYIEYQEKLLDLKRQIRIALAYPITVMVVACLILLFMFFTIVPNFQLLFLNSKIVLPTITQNLFVFAEFIRHYLIDILLGSLAMAYLTRFMYNRFYSFKYMLSKALIKVPVLGSCIEQFNMTIFSHTFALLYHSAIPIDVSLDKINLVISNPVYKKHLNDILLAIESGETLYEAVVNTNVFPKMVTATIHVGEETGELDTVLDNLGKSIEKTLNNKLSVLIAIFEPLTILLIMLVLGIVLVALYLPLFNLGNII